MKMNWNRVLRTLIQAASGAGIAFITALSANWSKDALITAAVEFGTTVVIAVLMNINEQSKEDNQ